MLTVGELSGRPCWSARRESTLDRMFSAKCTASAREVAGSRIANSSPPYRADMSEARWVLIILNAVRESYQSGITRLMAELIIEVLEIIRIDHE